MITPFDFVTVACFIGLVITFFQFTSREPRLLLHFLLSGIVFAVANQVGNAGSTMLALLLILAGIVYAAIFLRG